MAVMERIVAAASRILSKGRSGPPPTGGASLAWDFFETVPEVGTYADWVANAMSGASLFAGYRSADGTVTRAPSGSRAAELVASMAGGVDGQSVMLSDFGQNLAVTGDSWLVIIPDPESDTFGDDRWEVLSTEEVTVQRGKVKAVIDGEDFEITEYVAGQDVDPDAPVAIRIWKPSPRRKRYATSPVVRSLALLEELRLLNAAVAAIARSRITGRGLLLVPAGTRFPTQPGQDGAEDSLLDTLIEVMSTAIREPDSAAATTPVVLEVPDTMINGVKWIEFASQFDSLAIQLRDEAIRRFATGADVPAEVLLGLGDSNHWGAWALTAEALRMGAEPRLALVCQALTTEWLRPLLEAEGSPDASTAMVWYDTSSLRSSSNKGASALDAFDKGLISAAAARRELGFTEGDAPGAAEAARARSTANPTERTTLPVNETQAPPAGPGEAPERDITLAASGAPLDSFSAGTSAALAEAVDGLVWGALTAANRRMTLTPLVPRPHRPAARDLAASGTVHLHHPVLRENVLGYKLLDGAWERVPLVAARHVLDPVTLAASLNQYVTDLLVSGTVHDFENVPRLLAQMQVRAGAA